MGVVGSVSAQLVGEQQVGVQNVKMRVFVQLSSIPLLALLEGSVLQVSRSWHVFQPRWSAAHPVRSALPLSIPRLSFDIPLNLR